MTPEQARALATFADLSSEHSSLRLSLYLQWLQARARGETDAKEYPRSAIVSVPLSGGEIADRREAEKRREIARGIDDAERSAVDLARTERLFGTAFACASEGPAEPAAGSRLDSGVTSDPAAARPPPRHLYPGVHDPWLVAVEELTVPHREHAAARHRRTASLALAGKAPAKVTRATKKLRGSEFELERSPKRSARAFSIPEPESEAELGKDDLEAIFAALPFALDRDGLDAGGKWAEFEHAIRKDAKARRAHWHWGRARGHLKRFGSVVNCALGTIRTLCKGCGVIHETPNRCGLGVVCVPCRAKKAKKRNRRVAAAVAREELSARRGYLYQTKRKGGRWGHRFVTLTVPHIDATRWEDEGEGLGAVGARVRLLLNAWLAFSHRVQKWGRAVEKRDYRKIAWYRAFEWTLGADELGHPHFHLWVHSPYLAEADVAKWWAAALSAELDEPIGADKVIVSVRSARPDVHREVTKAGGLRLEPHGGGGAEMVRYIEGWTLQDIDSNGRRITPEVAAALYAELDQRRLVATSKGLLDARGPGCRFCGARRSTDVTVKTVKTTPVEPPAGRGGREARAPPTLT